MVLDNPPRLLLIEDDPDTACLIVETLTDYFGRECVHVCGNVAEAINVDVATIDLVISDMNLPDGTGLDVLEHLLLRRPDLPVVFVTAEGILENAIKAIRRGAYDYIVKAGDYLFSILLIVEKNLAIWQTKMENQRLQEQLARTLEQVQVKNRQLEQVVRQLETMAATDPLTGLANRRSFNESMARAFAEARRNGHELSCIMIDVDGFKPYNDTFGHQRGDELLRRIASLLKRFCRQSDVAGRFGGDEFILLLPQSDERTACQVAHRIQETFADEMRRLSSDEALKGLVTLSMGLACLNLRVVSDPEHLVAQADHALYRAKEAGKNRLVIHREPATPPADPMFVPAPGRIAV